MEFFVEGHSSLAPYLQIQEQVKLALLLGRLRPGDTLPSIRDVEQQTGVSQNVVRRAYLGLKQSGVLTMHHGKGVLVAKSVDYKHDSKLLQECEQLSRQTISKIQHLGISPTAFARYLYQKGVETERAHPIAVYVDATKRLATERADKISKVWQVNIPGLSLEELGDFKGVGNSVLTKVLTNYYRLDSVRKLLGKHKNQLLPLGLSFTPRMLEEFSNLPKKASVLLILDDDDYPSLSLIIASYREVLVDPSVKFRAVPISKLHNLKKYLSEITDSKVIISNRIWEAVPPELKKDRRVMHPLMDVDLASLEGVRIKAGIIV